MMSLQAIIVMMMAVAGGQPAQATPPPSPQVRCEDGATLHARLEGPTFREHRFKFLVLPDTDHVLEGWEGDNTWSVTLRHTSGRVCLVMAGRWRAPRRSL